MKSKKPTRTVRETLQLFQDTAVELRASSYVKQLPDQKWAVHCDDTPDGYSIVDIRPEHESRKSLILTLRLFENELKFKTVVGFYEHLPIAEEHKRRVERGFRVFNKALASGLQVQVDADGTAYTSKQIFETFMYGQYCHTEEPLRERLKQFQRTPFLWMLVSQEFDKLIGCHLEFIFWLCKANEIAIKALDSEAGV